MTSLGQRLIKAAKEASAIAKGEADPATYRVHVPAAIDVAKIRTGLGMTQPAFAGAFGFTAAAVRDWEQGRRQPEASARVLLLVIAKNPDAVREALRPEAA